MTEPVKSQADKWTNLLEAKIVLDELGVPFFLSNGTLLGFYRELDFIEHDPDIDLGVWIENFDDRIPQAMAVAGFDTYKAYGSLDSRDAGFQYSFYKRDIKVDIFFYVNESDHCWMPVFKKRHGNYQMRKYIFPLFLVDPTRWHGIKFWTPSPIHTYLEAQYGPDWQTPVVEWSYWDSPHNVQAAT